MSKILIQPCQTKIVDNLSVLEYHLFADGTRSLSLVVNNIIVHEYHLFEDVTRGPMFMNITSLKM
jgi:hypothetical protein